MKSVLLVFMLSILLISCSNNKSIEKSEIIKKIEKKTKLSFQSAIDNFSDFISGKKYPAEKFTVKATGEKVKNYIWLVREVQTTFLRNRFVEIIEYAADGPGSTATAYEGDREKYFVEVGWELDESIKLSDEEFSALDVSSIDPKKVVYHVTIYRVGE